MGQLSKEAGKEEKFIRAVLLYSACGIFLLLSVLLAVHLYKVIIPYADAKSALEKRLKDPYSVKYSDLEICPSGNGVMGKYNSKNGFGAYVGNKSFIYVNGSAVTVDDENFRDLLNGCYRSE